MQAVEIHWSGINSYYGSRFTPMHTYMHAFFNAYYLLYVLLWACIMAFHFPSNISLKIYNLFWYHKNHLFAFFPIVQWQTKEKIAGIQSFFFFFPAKEVKKAPMFLEKLQNCGVPEGYPVRLECRVVGMPPPIFYWKKDNETIPSNRERMRYCTIIPILEFLAAGPIVSLKSCAINIGGILKTISST